MRSPYPIRHSAAEHVLRGNRCRKALEIPEASVETVDRMVKLRPHRNQIQVLLRVLVHRDSSCGELAR